jgi:hypothetical protein
MAYYPCQRKTIMWYKKNWTAHFSVIVAKLFFLYRKSKSSKMSFYDFRLDIIDKLLPQNMAKRPQIKVPMHFVRHCPQGPWEKTLRKKCKFCTTQGKRTDTLEVSLNTA